MNQSSDIIEGFFSMLPKLEGRLELPGGLAYYSMALEHDAQLADKDNLTTSDDMPVRTRFLLAIFCNDQGACVNINMQDYDIRPGDILVVMPGSIVQHPVSFYHLSGVALMLSEAMYHVLPANYREVVKGMESSAPVIIMPNNEQHDVIKECLSLLEMLMRMPKSCHREDALQGCLQVMSNVLIDAPVKQRGENNHTKVQQTYTTFIGNVARDFRGHRDIQYYAALQCLSPKYFGQIISSASGRYPIDIIRDYVIVEAKVLLRSRNYNVEQVTNILHFSSQSSFGKYFKKATGVSPSGFMNGL